MAHRTIKSLWLTSLLGSTLLSPSLAYAQFGDVTRADQDLQLAPDSPFRDPDIIYLEADILDNNEETQILTASGEVEGRYQDRTLRADKVVYDLGTGQIIASGNVVLVQADGSSQYADTLELSNELDTGTATDFVARLPGGGQSAARFVARGANGEVELYNAYYTACEVCEEKPKPSWRLKARQVTQDNNTRTVQYRDATLEVFGVPIFYTPYLAHPDPSAERASGLLTPFAGFSQSRGITVQTPYYWAIDDHTEATITPRIFSKVNPLIEYQFIRQFHTGRVEVDGSFTYGSIFDRNGNSFDDPNVFTNPNNAPTGKRLRSHIFAKGLFAPSDFWTYGFGIQLTTDDNFLRRYGLSAQRRTQGLYEGESQRNTTQAFLIGQNDTTRLTVSTVGFQDRRDRIRENDNGTFTFSERNDRTLPILLPRIELEHNVVDPVFNGRFTLDGDLTVLTRDEGNNYTRGTIGGNYLKTFIAPGGFEFKPFANARFDQFEFEPEEGDSSSFNRTLGQVGLDVRYPLVNTTGSIDWTLEPRAQITQSFGNAKLENFRRDEDGLDILDFTEDAGNADLSQALLWQSNKASGFDFWQEGLRADIGGSLSAEFGSDNHATLFVGQSYAINSDGIAVEDIAGENGGFLVGSGLAGDQSDIIGEIEVGLGKWLSTRTRTRFNEDTNSFTRIDSTLGFKSKWLSGGARYFRLSSANRQFIDNPDAPPEEISGNLKLKISDNFYTTYRITRDLDRDTTRRQTFGVGYRDDCLLLEVQYTDADFSNDANANNSGIGFRISLLTLGGVGG